MAKWKLVNAENMEPFICDDVYSSKMLTGDEMAGQPVININEGTLKPGGTTMGGGRGGVHEETEIYYIIEGDGFVVLDDVPVPVKAEDIIVIPGGVYHWIDNRNSDKPFRLFTLWPKQEQNGVYFERLKAWGTSVRSRDDAYTEKRLKQTGEVSMQFPKETLKMEGLDPKQLAKYIDHTILQPDTTRETIKRFCDEARENKFAGVCFNPVHIALAAERLKGSGVAVAAVIGFPLGATTPAVKAFEASEAVGNGATELDMVINVGAVKEADFDLVEKDIRGVVDAAAGKALVKVIIETCLLTDTEKTKACEIALKAGAKFVKTSSGFSTGGATAEDVALMKKAVGEAMGVKASTGVRTVQAVVDMINAGACRIGTSRGLAIISESGGNT